MSDTEATTPAEQPAPSTEEKPTEPESQPEPQAPEQAEQATQEGGGESAPAEQQQQEEAPAEGGEQPEQQEAEQPAAEGGEGEGEGEKAAGEGEGGEGEGEKKEEGEGKAEEEAEQEKEEPIVITPEGNKYWLSTEDVLAKGVPENEVENFKTFYYKHGHSIQTWYEQLKDHTHQTEFITLSKEEIEALSAEGDPSEEQQQVLNGLKDRVNGAIELYGEEGAMVRIGGRSAKDAILERDEESFIAEVQDDVINNLEVEKQSANAYAIWKDEKHPGAFRRGLTKIRQSFRRSRPATAQKEKPKLEEEEKKEGEEEAPKAEEAGEGEAPKPEGEEQPKEDGEAAGGAEVTVEVDIEGGADKGEEKPAEEKPAEEQPAAAEPQAEEPTPAAAEPEPAEPKPAEEGEKKEGEGEGEKPAAEGEGEKKEGGEDGEIQKVEEGEGEKKEGEGEEEKKEGEESQPKSKRTSSRKKKSGESHHHHYPKSKHDNLDNQIMRAFLKSVGARYKIANGEEALQMLRKSGQIRRDLNQLKPFCGIEGVQFSMSVTKWDSQIPQYPGMDLRGFVYGNELRALSQYNDSAYFPDVDHYKHTIQIKVENFFKEHIQESLKELENYVIDFFVSPEKIYVVRLNPFYTGTGACLFTWTEHAKVLTRGPFEYRIVTASKTAPEAYSSLQPFWSTMLESVLQKKKDEQRQSTSRGCVIL